MNKPLIPIFFTIDEGYAQYVSVAIDSLRTNASKDNNYIIHIIHEELKDETKNKLKTLETDNLKIEFTEMEKSIQGIEDVMGTRLRADFFTLTIYFRIFIPSMFPQYDKGIYIDSDIVVPGDISELYNTDLKDNLIGAVNDISTVDDEILCNYFINAVGIKKDEYINSGLLLMNMKKLREVKFDEHFLYLLNKYHFDTIAPDQDYINSMCNGKILYLNTTWDAMPVPNKEPMNNPKLIHYNLFFKPWHYDNVDYEEYFWEYAKKSLFYKEILADKESFTDECKKEDKVHFDLMLKRAVEIPNQETTFKSVFSSSLESRI